MTYTPTKMQSSTDGSCKKRYKVKEVNLKRLQKLVKKLENNGVDMIEIGLPFSDPLADGPTIQESSTQALKNGMHTELIFEQLKDIRKSVSIPLILMGYFNPMLQYGVEAFCRKCKEIGIDGFIIPISFKSK